MTDDDKKPRAGKAAPSEETPETAPPVAEVQVLEQEPPEKGAKTDEAPTHIQYLQEGGRSVFKDAGAGGGNLILYYGVVEPITNFANPSFAAQLVADGRAQFVTNPTEEEK